MYVVEYVFWGTLIILDLPPGTPLSSFVLWVITKHHFRAWFFTSSIEKMWTQFCSNKQLTDFQSGVVYISLFLHIIRCGWIWSKCWFSFADLLNSLWGINSEPWVIFFLSKTIWRHTYIRGGSQRFFTAKNY